MLDTQQGANLHLDNELSGMKEYAVLLDNICQNIKGEEEINYAEIASIQETVKEINENHMKIFSGTRTFTCPKIAVDQHLVESLENTVLTEVFTIDLTEETADPVLTLAADVRSSGMSIVSGEISEHF